MYHMHTYEGTQIIQNTELHIILRNYKLVKELIYYLCYVNISMNSYIIIFY